MDKPTWKGDTQQMRTKLSELLKRAEREPALKERLMRDPAGTLVAEKIGFKDAADVRIWRMSSSCGADAGSSCLDCPETDHRTRF